MFSRARVLFCITLVLCGFATRAAALELAVFDIISEGSSMSDMTGVQVTIFDQSGGPMGGPAYRLGDYLTITPADVGSTFTITAATDADFTAFLAMITNGNDDGFGYSVAGVPMFSSVGHSWTEGNLFAAGTRAFGPGNFTSIGQLAGPDFAGYQISAVTLTINTFDLTSGGGWNSHNFRATATIVAVPEPGTTASLVSGAALLCASFVFRRRRRAR